MLFIYKYNFVSKKNINIKLTIMDDESRWNLEKNFFKKLVIKILNVGNVFQSIWIRHYPILSDFNNGEFVLRRFNFVLRIGFFLWFIFLISQAFRLI